MYLRFTVSPHDLALCTPGRTKFGQVTSPMSFLMKNSGFLLFTELSALVPAGSMWVVAGSGCTQKTMGEVCQGGRSGGQYLCCLLSALHLCRSLEHACLELCCPGVKVASLSWSLRPLALQCMTTNSSVSGSGGSENWVQK